jgi:AbrB family looped-hinge helix DNA binding protein
MKCTVELKTRGQVTIPAKVRKALNLKKGELLILDVRKIDEDHS